MVRAAAMLVFMASIFGPYTVFREDGQQLFFAMCSFYACYLICFFTVLGDYARARESGALRLPGLAVSLLLCFCTGMQSLRQTCVLILPLLAYEALAALRRLWKRQPVYPKGKRMRLWRTLAYTGANILGLAVIRLLPVKRHEIYSGASIFSGASLGEKFRDVHTALITVTGYEATREGDSRPFFILMFLAMTLLVLTAAALLLRGRRGAKGVGCFWLTALIGCLAVIAASFVTSVRLRPIYLFLYYILPALSLVLIAEKARPRLLTGLIAALCILAAANLFFSYRDDLHIVIDKEPTPAEQIADWALDNGCELVYGSLSMSAPSVAVCADGKLIAGCWQDDFLFKVSPLINIRDVYRIDDYKRAVFVFLETEVPGMLAETGANGVEMTDHGQYGYYHIYTASKQCLWPVTELIDYAERFPEYN